MVRTWMLALGTAAVLLLTASCGLENNPPVVTTPTGSAGSESSEAPEETHPPTSAPPSADRTASTDSITTSPTTTSGKADKETASPLKELSVSAVYFMKPEQPGHLSSPFSCVSAGDRVSAILKEDGWTWHERETWVSKIPSRPDYALYVTTSDGQMYSLNLMGTQNEPNGYGYLSLARIPNAEVFSSAATYQELQDQLSALDADYQRYTIPADRYSELLKALEIS